MPELPPGADCSSGTGGARLRGPERAGRAPGRAGTPVVGRFRRPSEASAPPLPVSSPGARRTRRRRVSDPVPGGTWGRDEPEARAPRPWSRTTRARHWRSCASGGWARRSCCRRRWAQAWRPTPCGRCCCSPASAECRCGCRCGAGARGDGLQVGRDARAQRGGSRGRPRAPSPPRRGTRVWGLSPACLLAQVPYVGASERQVEHVLSLLRGRPGKMVDLGSGDGRIVRSACRGGPLSPAHLPTFWCPQSSVPAGAGRPQVWSPPGCGLRAEPVASGAGSAACLEGGLCRQRLLPP